MRSSSTGIDLDYTTWGIIRFSVEIKEILSKYYVGGEEAKLTLVFPLKDKNRALLLTVQLSKLVRKVCPIIAENGRLFTTKNVCLLEMGGCPILITTSMVNSGNITLPFASKTLPP